MTFVFRFKRRGEFFWTKRNVVGYQPNQEIDRMTLYFLDGGIEEIPEWSKCRARLGQDWVLAFKKKMEKDAGAAIPLNVG